MGLNREEKRSMLLSALVRQYEEWLKNEQPISKTTVQNYRCRVRRFIETLPPDAPLSTLTHQNITRYVHRVGSSSPHAVRMHFAALRHFCAWLVREEWLKESPLVHVTLPKVTRRRRDTIPEEAVTRIMDATDRLPVSPYRRALVKCAMSLMVYGGLRISEALFLRVENVRLDTGEVFVEKGKGGKTRSIYLCKEGLDAVRALLRLRPECDHEFLLAHNTRYPMRWHGLRNALNALHTVAGIKEHYTPHQLRHAYATRLLQNGATLADVQLALGHSRLETTSIYVHSSAERLKQIAHLASLSTMPPIPPPPQTEQQAAAPRDERRRIPMRRR